MPPATRVHGLLRLVFGVSEVAIFGLGSIGAFLAFDWPPLLHQVVLGYLVAAVVLRLTLVLGRFLLAPDIGGPAERFCVIPLSADAARFWFRRLALFVGWFAFSDTPASTQRRNTMRLCARCIYRVNTLSMQCVK